MLPPSSSSSAVLEVSTSDPTQSKPKSSCHLHNPAKQQVYVNKASPTSRNFMPTYPIPGVSQYSPSIIQWPDKDSKINKENEGFLKVCELNEIKQRIKVVKTILQDIDDGDLSISAYDTAWVALVKDTHGSNAPQFPSSLEWIVKSQLPDGSWGDRGFFSPYDRLSNTLACVVALKTWHIHPKMCEKGMAFLHKNFHRLQDEDPEHMPSGFEVRVPFLIEMAQNLGLEFDLESHVLQDLYATKELKLKRIPKEMLHNMPTTLLYSLEGMPGLDWERLLELQHPNGSFLCSTASTAFALAQTKDEKCLKYLTEIVNRFNGGVPHCYPMDLFERLWVVDRLDRLGISRHFKSQIKECLDYVYRHWTPKGLSWSRDTIELDIDDTSMGFRLLRLHGYVVNADAIRTFEKEGQFFCFIGQSSQGVSEMLSLYRASQMLFPGEKVLEEAKTFTSKFLREKQEEAKVADRWIITKDLEGEVQYHLEVPWYANLPRIETRHYIDQYGGEDDVWIGKVLYRMHNVSNNLYLELAKLDYNHCQRLHHLEWVDIQRWYDECNLRQFGLSKDGLLKAYFLAMSCIFEPDRATERIAWAKTTALTEAIFVYFNDKAISIEQRRIFLQAFNGGIANNSNNRLNLNHSEKGLIKAINRTLLEISSEVQKVHHINVYHNLKHMWEAWMLKWKTQEDSHITNEAALLVHTINLCRGYSVSSDVMYRNEFIHLTNLTNKICNHLSRIRKIKAERMEHYSQETSLNLSTRTVDVEMQELMQHVLISDGINHEIKEMFMIVAKSFYYSAYCEPNTIDRHISKVLFDRVL